MTADRQARDRGSAGVEGAFAAAALLGVGLFMIGALRVTTAVGDVGAAARAGARAAATVRDGDGLAAARSVVARSLADRGRACVDEPAVQLIEGEGVVTVTVACVVALDDVGLGGFAPAGGAGAPRTVSASATEMVDRIRGGQP